MDIGVVKQEIQKGLRLYKAFENGEAVLSVLEGLAANEKELKASVASLQAENAKLFKEGEAAAAEVAQAKRDASDVRAKAKEQSADIIAKANAEAQRIAQASAEALAASNAELAQAKDAIVKAGAELKEVEAKAAKATALIEKQKAALASL